MDEYEIKCMSKEWQDQHTLEYERNKSIFKVKKKDLYHYTSLEVLGKILENDQFRATHVRFSNDIEEYNAGKYLMKSLDGSVHEKDCFMICFCQKPDLLSQWREYARAGVSLELDFSFDSYFTITQDEKELYTYAEPIEVIYANYEIKKLESDIAINLESIPIKMGEDRENLSIMNKCIENYKRRFSEAEDGFSLSNAINAVIPYIKNGAFEEEQEVRIIFELTKGDRQLVCYADDKRVGFKRPYLNVKCGIQEKSTEKNVKIVKMDRRINSELYEKIKKCLEPGVDIVNLEDPYNIESIYIGTGENQEKIFNEVRKQLVNNPELSEGYKIWCEGHWPIRSIMIGPSPNQGIIAESVSHYIKSYYWMRYVEVKCSKIPYREKRNP